jgi:hypothetical protein
VRYPALLAAAAAAAVAAQLVREVAKDTRASWPDATQVPYAPSAAAAPYVSLGYRELAADLMWMRVLAYLGGETDTAAGMRALVEATLALDPWFKRAYDGGLAIESATHGVDNDAHLAAAAILERGMQRFPLEWKYPYGIGQIYIVDLITTDPAQKRAWTEKGVAMLERALRLESTPPAAAALAAHLQQELGRREAAIKVLRDKIALTEDPRARRPLLEQLAKLENADSASLAAAFLQDERAFRREWLGARPRLPRTLYVLLGNPRDPYLPPAALAIERDLIGTNAPEELEPLTDPEPAPAPAP